MNPPSPAIDSTGTSGRATLAPKAVEKAITQRALIAAAQVSPRLVDRHDDARGITHLRQLINKDAVFAQFLAYDLSE